MPERWLIRLFPVALLVIAGCSDSSPVPEINSGNAYALAVKLVSFGKRYAGTAENRQQASFIAAKAAEYGAAVTTDRFSAMTTAGTLEFANITAEIKGRSDDFVIIGSHYDIKRIMSAPDFEGANDSASSTALLLEMIRAVKASGSTPPLTLKFVFFDGEECLLEYSGNDGFWGSRHYAQKMQDQGLAKQCKAVIVLDMIGDSELGVTLPANSSRQLAEKMLDAAEATGNKQYFALKNFEILDDHQPFLQQGIPAIDIIDFEYGPDNVYWHTGADKIDKISGKSMKVVGDCVLRLVLSGKYW
ncbi:MAG: M28 family metallopeptidase [Victivallaceae bacterium]